jgi:hypothetical protein
MRCRLVLLTLLILAVLPVGPATACSIPVFRYALERWESAPCQAIVFHRRPLGLSSRNLLGALDDPQRAINLSAQTVDVSGLPLGRLRPQEDGPPWLVVRTAQARPNDPHAWQGPLTADTVRLLLDSPARRRLVERLTSGDAVVFVLLESGDEAADRRAGEMLQRELARLEKEIVLPKQEEEGPQLRTKVPLRVSFAVLRLSRRDPDEAGFVRLLLRSEDGLLDERGPIVFPIFGRGRVLCGLSGDYLNETRVRDLVRYLCGACSCEVKELNPGSDLLLAADWDALLQPGVPEAGPQTSSPEPPAPSPRQPIVRSAAPAPREEAGRRGLPVTAGGDVDGEDPPLRRALKAGAVGAGILLVISGVLLLRGRFGTRRDGHG